KLSPPIANAGRDVVVQPGEIVTLNGTESVALHAAHIVDYRWSLQSGDPSLKMEVTPAGRQGFTKTDLQDQVRLPNLHPGSYVLKLSVKDSNGQSGDDEVIVLVLSSELWHYKAETGNCEKFIYGGCKPNKNNYLSEGECMSACRGVTVSQTFNRLLNVNISANQGEMFFCCAHVKVCVLTGSDLAVLSSGSIALAAFLAVAILALLAILGYCFLRRRRKRSSNPHALPHVALPEQDTLVYNSTTKPA
ncbi:hypothetical protein XENOCAPTIV_006055, partial [Xenoophorus captivus]